MKIIQVAPPYLNLNDRMLYGGIERLIMGLKKEFDKLGCENKVIAPEGDNIIGDILPTLPESYWTSTNRNSQYSNSANLVFSNLAHLSKAIEYINSSDAEIVHDHNGKLFPFLRLLNKPLLTTLHGPSDWFWNPEIYQSWMENNHFNAVSKAQREDYNFLKIDYIVPNGLDLKSFPLGEGKGGYLFSLGQICKNKGQHLAIEIAKKSGRKLIIGGIVSDDPTDSEDRRYFEEEIKPHIEKGKVEFIGPLNDVQKKYYYKNASGFLMPISCNEAFGLVLIESLACGTPVIAYNRGAIPEIVEDNKNGFIARDVNHAVELTNRLNEIDRKYCRDSVIEKFDIEKVAQSYLRVYEDIIRGEK